MYPDIHKYSVQLACSLLLLVCFFGDVQAKYFKVEPEVTEWENTICYTGSIGTNTWCAAKGGSWNGDDCVGENHAEWAALSVVEKVRRLDHQRFGTCNIPTVTFSGWDQPSHSLQCWTQVTGYKYGVQNFSTSNLVAEGMRGADCDVPGAEAYSGRQSRDVTCPVGTTARDEGEGLLCYKWCPEGEILLADNQCGPPPDEDPCKENGQNTTANPCNVASGNKFRSEPDIIHGALTFTRHYNSDFPQDGTLGVGWRHNYQREILVHSATSVTLVSEKGSGEPWQKVNGVWEGDPDTRVLLTEQLGGYRVTFPDSSYDDYDADGKLTSYTDKNGQQTALSYDADDRLSLISNVYGHTITLGYEDERLATVTDDESAVIQYLYDSQHNLTTVVYPDLTPNNSQDNPVKSYHYEDGLFPHHLTGITDELNQSYASFAYDTDGKAYTSELAQTVNAVGQQKVTLNYEPDPDPNDDLSSTLVTDADGEVQRWAFKKVLGVYKLTARTNLSDNKGLSQTWDANGNLDTVTDAEGRVTKYTYYPSNQRHTMREAFGTADERLTTYEYYSAEIDLVTEVTSPSVYPGQLKTVTTAYDQNLNVESVTIEGFDSQGNPVSRITSYKYDAQGKVTEIDGPRLDVIDKTTIKYYDCAIGGKCGQVEKITNAAGHITTFDVYDATGRLKQMTTPNDVVITASYHPRGWLQSVTETPPVGSARTTIYDYFDNGLLEAVTFADGSSLTYGYSAAHELTSITDDLGNKVTYQYDSRGNRSEESVIDGNGVLARTLLMKHDVRNVIEEINNSGSITTIVNDATGNVSAVTDANNANNPSNVLALDNQYDGLNRLDFFLDAYNNVTDLEYDAQDNLVEVEAPNGAATVYEFDDLGNLTKEVSPDRGTLTYAHDDAGNVTSMTDARGITSVYTYDALNRLTSITYPIASNNVVYQYDSGVDCGLSVGRLCQVTDASGVHSYEYDAWGNVSEHHWQTLSALVRVGYKYDALNRISHITYPSGRQVTYSRDLIGRVDKVTTNAVYYDEIVADSFEYRADGLRTKYRSGNHQINQAGFDLRGQMTTQHVDGALINTISYDANGNVEDITQIDQSRDYGYDLLNRLTSDDWLSGTNQAADWVYNYDANGNRDDHQINLAVTEFDYAPNSNRLSAIDQNAVSMDAAGNITYLPRVTGDLTLHYDDRGHISAAIENGDTTQYTYNYARQRQIKSQGAYHTLYVNDLAGRLLAAVDESGRTYEEYIYGNETDYSPIQYRVYEDTEADTLEAHQAYLASVAVIRTPTDNPQGSCQSTQTSSWDRYHSGVLFEDIDTSTGSGISNPAFAKHVPILLWFLGDSEGGGNGGDPEPAPEVGVDSSVILDNATTTFTWSTISGATEYVLEVATSATALNLNPDITRVCAEQNTSAAVSGLPLNGTDVYLRVWALVNGQWLYEDHQLGTAGLDDAREHVTRIYLVADHLQTPRFGYDTNGQLVWRWASDAFGNEAANADVDADGKPVTMNLRFPGQYYDSESGLHYNWNRYYDPGMGRYVSSDPIGLYGGLNTFGYVFQNSLKSFDFLGLDGESAAQWAYDKAYERHLRSQGGGRGGRFIYRGNDDYQYIDPHSEVRGRSGQYFGGRFSPKCNAFVYDALSAGGNPPGRDANGTIPVAGSWDDPESSIPGYFVLPEGSQPRRGDVVADAGHVGLFYPLPDGSSGTISAATDPQRVVHGDWGFRPNSSPTIWRCECDN